MAVAKSDNSRAADVIRNWLRNRSTLEFLSTCEEIYNPDFKVFESDHFKKDAGKLYDNLRLFGTIKGSIAPLTISSLHVKY